MLSFPDTTINKKIVSRAFGSIEKTKRPHCTFCQLHLSIENEPKVVRLLHGGPFVSCVESDERLKARPSGAVN